MSLLDNGGDPLTVSSAGPFVFPTLLPDGAAYDVTVSTAPPTLACSTTAGSGTVAKADVTNIAVNCKARSYSSVSADSGGGPNNDGTLYSYTLADGAYTILHIFSGSDGATPYVPPVFASNTMLYGVT